MKSCVCALLEQDIAGRQSTSLKALFLCVRLCALLLFERRVTQQQENNKQTFLYNKLRGFPMQPIYNSISNLYRYFIIIFFFFKKCISLIGLIYET